MLTVSQAETAAAAGAKFVVSPGFDAAVVDWCIAEGMPVMPGVITPTEIGMALNKGLDVLKFFPAEAAGGVKTLKAISAPYRGVKFVPTGGIRPANLPDYLHLPAVHACGGSWLVAGRLMARPPPRFGNPPMNHMRIITLGEIMLRLKPPGFERFLQTPVLETAFGGGEANVALSLAVFGLDVAFVTALPENPIADACIRCLRSYGVDTSLVVRGGERTGTYFLEAGANQRPSSVVYDRANSATPARRSSTGGGVVPYHRNHPGVQPIGC